MGSVAKSCMGKGFLIYEEMQKLFNHIQYEEAISIYDFATDPFWISFYEKIWYYFFHWGSRVGERQIALPMLAG